jgi:hypothetical protein
MLARLIPENDRYCMNLIDFPGNPVLFPNFWNFARVTHGKTFHAISRM